MSVWRCPKATVPRGMETSISIVRPRGVQIGKILAVPRVRLMHSNQVGEGLLCNSIVASRHMSVGQSFLREVVKRQAFGRFPMHLQGYFMYRRVVSTFEDRDRDLCHQASRATRKVSASTESTPCNPSPAPGSSFECERPCRTKYLDGAKYDQTPRQMASLCQYTPFRGGDGIVIARRPVI